MIPLFNNFLLLMQKISAIIPTYNEEHNIIDAIESVSWADEILIVDSFSTDRTIQLAKEKGAKIIQREYQYSASQKNWAIPQAKNQWILLLDADERVSDKLRIEIQKTLENEFVNDAYWIKRQNYFMGKKVRFSGWQGDKVIRLFKRDVCRYEDKNVHAEIICNGSVGFLNEKLTHFTFKDIKHYLEKWDRYSTWSAKDHFDKGQRPNLYHFIAKPAFRFFRDYIIRLGVLDGLTGLIICSLSSMGIFMRYLKLKQLIKDQ